MPEEQGIENQQTRQFLSGWKGKSIKVAINKDLIDEDLADFLLDIYIDSLPVEIDFSFNSRKIAVTLDDGITQCFYTTYQRSGAVEEKLVVNVPVVSCDKGTVLYLYYDPTHEDNDLYAGGLLL